MLSGFASRPQPGEPCLPRSLGVLGGRTGRTGTPSFFQLRLQAPPPLAASTSEVGALKGGWRFSSLLHVFENISALHLEIKISILVYDMCGLEILFFSDVREGVCPRRWEESEDTRLGRWILDSGRLPGPDQRRSVQRLGSGPQPPGTPRDHQHRLRSIFNSQASIAQASWVAVSGGSGGLGGLRGRPSGF